jgi:hypothetical protein
VNTNTLKFMRFCETHNLSVVESYSDKSGEREKFWSVHKDYILLACVSDRDIESMSEEELEDIVYSVSINSIWS